MCAGVVKFDLLGQRSLDDVINIVCKVLQVVWEVLEAERCCVSYSHMVNKGGYLNTKAWIKYQWLYLPIFKGFWNRELPYRCPGGSDVRVVIQRRSDDVNARSIGTVVAALLNCFLHSLLDIAADIKWSLKEAKQKCIVVQSDQMKHLYPCSLGQVLFSSLSHLQQQDRCFLTSLALEQLSLDCGMVVGC